MLCRADPSVVPAWVGSLLLVPLLAAGCGEAGESALSPARAGERAREILVQSDPFVRSARWGSLLERAGPEALPALREALAAAPVDYGEPELTTFAMWWARFDPEAAFEWVRRDWRAESWPVLVGVFRLWGHAEPQQAFAELGRVSQPLQTAAITGLIAGWHESGRPGLVEQVQAIPDLANRQKVAETLARRVVLGRGAAGALRWLEEIADPGFRKIMERRIASAAAEQGEAPVVAAWATPRVTSGAAHPSGFPRRIATRWVRRDPEATWAWLASLPAGKDRDDGVMEAFRDWLRFHPGAALLWIRDAELEPWLEPALAIHARRLGSRQPEKALETVSGFSNQAERDRFTLMILRGWAARDPQAAGAWLAEAELPEDLRRRASALLDRSGRASEGDG